MELQAQGAGRKVQFVVQDQNFAGWDAVKMRQGDDRLTGTVHEGARLQKPGFADARRLAEELGLRGERSLQLVGQMVDKPMS